MCPVSTRAPARFIIWPAQVRGIPIGVHGTKRAGTIEETSQAAFDLLPQKQSAKRLDGRNEHMPQRTPQNGNVMQRQDQTKADQWWEERVKPRLPASLETQARALGAFQGKRAVERAPVRLRAFRCFVLSRFSHQQWRGWSRLVGGTSTVLSAPAWHQRLPKRSLWLLWLCNALLDVRLTTGAWCRRSAGWATRLGAGP